MTVVPVITLDPLSVSKAAKELSVSRWTLYNWISRGKIKAFRFGDILFIPRSEIQQFRQEKKL